MKKTFSILSVLLLLCVGCVANDVVEEEPVYVPNSAFFCSDSKVLYAGSFSSLDPYDFEYRLNEPGIPASEYLLAFSPKNEAVDIPLDDSCYAEGLIFWFIDHYTGREDYSVYREYLSQLKEYCFDVKASSVPQARIQFRTEEIETMTITSNCILFGRIPGENLTDKFDLYRTLGHPKYPPFYFTADKKLVTSGIEGKPLNQFISERSLIPAMTFLKLNEIPSEIPLDLKFTISIILKDKGTLTATTPTVRILTD